MLHALTMGRLPCRRHVPFLSTHNPCCPTRKLLSTSPCGHPLSSPLDTSPCAVPCWHITSLLLPRTSTVGHLPCRRTCASGRNAPETEAQEDSRRLPAQGVDWGWVWLPGCGAGSAGSTGALTFALQLCLHWQAAIAGHPDVGNQPCSSACDAAPSHAPHMSVTVHTFPHFLTHYHTCAGGHRGSSQRRQVSDVQPHLRQRCSGGLRRARCDA